MTVQPAPPTPDLDKLLQRRWPFRPSVARIALKIAVDHNVECIRVHGRNDDEHQATQASVTAVGNDVKAIGTQVSDLTKTVNEFVAIKGDLNAALAERRTFRAVIWAITKVVFWCAAGVGAIASLAGAWPVLSWAFTGMLGALMAHLRS